MNLTLEDIKEIQHYLNINSDGQFNAQGVLVEDDEAGQELFENLFQFEEFPAWYTEMDGTRAIVEVYDSIYIVQSIDKTDSDEWTITMPYAYKDKFNLNSLSIDEWDRFHGFSLRGVPFVFSRKAQAQFFDLLDEFDDDTFTVNGIKYTPPSWPKNDPKSENTPESWSNRYLENNTPWDKSEAHPALKDVLAQIKINKARILVAGCGRAHDAAFLAKQGHIVTAIDYSDVAIEEANKLYGDIKNLKLVKADALNLNEEYWGQFDLVFEHTLYCAIPPEKRNNLVQSWKKALSEDGHLLGVFFSFDQNGGPPFGGSEWELDSRLTKHFEFLYWTRWKKSPLLRRGNEVIIYAQKK